ncbi:hypothetical protein C8Q76DRAFT_610444 [Earliella scabrosa]|nr:hypothetical protein C8Q76DRAFT_610444 [Earliella scabrosa]
MYLAGVIPGPTKPSDEQINHFLALLVDELQEFWDPGVYYSKTAICPLGRHVRAAMIPLVCDLLAARQMAGFAPHYHTYGLCSVCALLLQEKDEIDPKHFPPRDLGAHRETAIAWRDAESTHQRRMIYDHSGIRWSELLRLSYWNPILYTVIDTMHNLYLGLLERHVRDFWGIATDEDDGDSSGRDSVKAPNRPSEAVMKTAHDSLLHDQDKVFEAYTKPLLYHLCRDLGLRRTGTIKLLVKRLRAWRTKEGLPQPLVAPEPPTAIPLAGAVSDDHQSIAIPASVLAESERVLITTTSMNVLVARGKPSLMAMCQARGMRTDGTRQQLAQRLWNWVRGMTFDPCSRGSCRSNAVAQCKSAREARKEEKEGRYNYTSFWRKQPASGEKLMAQTQGMPTTAALGRQTLTEYVRDRDRMELPSWINPAPRAFGTSQHGKLSADQWRTVCTVNLPITLGRTWGLETGRRYAMLENFLSLVDAVQTLGYLEIAPDDMRRADELLQTYLSGVKELYKGGKIQPNHHISLHITVFLALFGPVHSWRSFAFERFNYMLQTLNINKNFGELETTFMVHSCRIANFRPLLRTDAVKTAMPSFSKVLESLAQEDRRGIRLDDIMRLSDDTNLGCQVSDDGQQIDLETSTYGAILNRLTDEQASAVRDGASSVAHPPRLSRRAVSHPWIIYQGLHFKPRWRARGDSNIIFTDPNTALAVPGRLELIVTVESRGSDGGRPRDTFIIVRRQQALCDSDRQLDPYRKLGKVAGYLFYDEYEGLPIAIRPTSVMCHFAKTTLGRTLTRLEGLEMKKVSELTFKRSCIHVLPLGRVSLLSSVALIID